MIISIGQAYILALKNGDNSIIINGAANAAYDPNMTELDPAWAEAIRTSKNNILLIDIQAKYFYFKEKFQNM